MHKDLKKYAKHYADDEALALALFGEATQLIETILFKEGELLEKIEIIPDGLPDNGYHVTWWTDEGDQEYEETIER